MNEEMLKSILETLGKIHEQMVRQNDLKEKEMELVEKKYDAVILSKIKGSGPEDFKLGS